MKRNIFCFFVAKRPKACLKCKKNQIEIRFVNNLFKQFSVNSISGHKARPKSVFTKSTQISLNYWLGTKIMSLFNLVSLTRVEVWSKNNVKLAVNSGEKIFFTAKRPHLLALNAFIAVNFCKISVEISGEYF